MCMVYLRSEILMNPSVQERREHALFRMWFKLRSSASSIVGAGEEKTTASRYVLAEQKWSLETSSSLVIWIRISSLRYENVGINSGSTKRNTWSVSSLHLYVFWRNCWRRISNHK